MRTLLPVALCLSLLVVSALAYSVIPLNKKSNVTVEKRHDQYKRSNAPLGGGAGRVGYYFVQLQVGSQNFRVDIDTGSSTLFIVGPDCHLLDDRSQPCPYAQSYYQGAASYMGCESGCYQCQSNVCIMHASYGDGSEVYGAVRTESIQIGGYTTTGPAAISYYQSTDFASTNGETHMDGLWGMAYSGLNGGLPTVVDRLVTSGMPNVFSICFSNSGGYLVMGGIDTSMQTSSASYTAITETQYYAITVSGIAVGSTNLAVTFPKIIVDSGTTFNYVTQSIMNALHQQLQGYADSSWFSDGNSIYCSSVVLASMPNIYMTFPQVGGGTFQLTLKPSQYTVSCSGGGYAFGFVPTTGLNILGDAFMQGFNTIFDRANGQIGFAPVSTVNCRGTIAVNDQSYTVPGTKSIFSSGLNVVPSTLLVLAALALAFISH